jgi:hypothetical protein
MLLTFPNGHVVDVQFDEIAHSYVVAHQLADGQFSDFRPTHGATAPLVVVPKPFIKKWVAKECVNATLELISTQPGIVEQLPQFFEDTENYASKAKDPKTGKTIMTYYRYTKQYPWLKALKGAADAKATEGKELGTWLHSSIENYYRSGRQTLPILTPAVQGMWDSFQMFDQYFKPVPDADGLEFLVYSLNFGYSGQGDFRGVLANKYCIVDWKSTNRSEWNPDGVSIDYFFQLGGLAQAEYERTGKWVDDLAAVNLDKLGEEPRVVFASELGMSPQDAARAYISCFNNYHMVETWDYKFKKR